MDQASVEERERAELAALLELKLKLDARDNFLRFCQHMSPDYKVAPHIRLLVKHLEALERRDIKKLMVFMPPRHSKTWHVSIHFPAWYVGRHPKHKIVLASHSADLAVINSKAVRSLLDDPLYPFGVKLAKDSQRADLWQTDAGGMCKAIGVDGKLSGFGANLLSIDDPLEAKEARSPTVRETVWQWYTETASARKQPKAIELITMTRWHEDDLAGRVLNSPVGKEWTVLRLSAIADELPDPVGRQIGEWLWPDFFSAEELLAQKAVMSSRSWAAVYQQRPSAQEGNIFKREWMNKRWRPSPDGVPPWDPRSVILSVDGAWKTGVGNDYSVIAVWGMSQTDYYLVDLWRGRVESPDLQRRIIDMAAQHAPNAVLIEDTASGIAAIQALQRTTALNIIPVKAVASKESRAEAVTPIFEAGRVCLPEDAPWIGDFVEEHCTFPGLHDDMVDTTSQALARLAGLRSGLFLDVRPPTGMVPRRSPGSIFGR